MQVSNMAYGLYAARRAQRIFYLLFALLPEDINRNM
jgi:hypothetical protein